MKKYLLTLVTVVSCLLSYAQSDYDLNEPFGFCTRSSRTDAASTYDITGGGCYTYPIPDGFTGKVITLKSSGQDMQGTIQNAIKQNDVIIFDGADGDFIVSSNVGITASNKTLIGINKARICTKWYVTDEIKAALDEAGVPTMSTSSGTGGKLPNGQNVSEEAEYNTRLIIYNQFGNDADEKYRRSGCLTLNGCQNIIIRNIVFQGPGSIDVSGNDLISCTGAKHCWVDHCEFLDGMDGNFDITQKADFNTVSWCIFRYTGRSYMHQNTNLIGSSNSEATGYLNTTFAFNWWGTGCKQRMPMGRVGKIHMLNNYFTSTTASNCINPRINSEFLIEGNYFGTGVKRFYQSNDNPVAVTWASNNYSVETNQMGTPSSFGTTVTVPYSYSVATTADIPAEVQANAGATLKYGDGGGGPTGTTLIDYPTSKDGITIGGTTIETTFQNLPAYQLKNGYTSDGAYNGNSINLTIEGGFKAGDFITVAGGIKNSDTSKRGTVAIFTLDGTTATVVKQFDDFPNFNGAGAAFVNQQYTLEADADKLYLGRNGNTATNVTLIKVTRGTDTGIQELPVKVISNGVIYNLKGQKVNSSYKGIAIKDGKKVLIK
ncbi:MAG: hypothetical protein J6V87_04410 [Prevotella sp.]|nr:hypothetical protein [Prevotella sp.]